MVAVHAAYASCLVIRGRFDEAVAEARLAVQLEPYSPPVAVTLGEALYFRREFGQASKEFQRATNAVPNSIILRLELGRSLTAGGQYDQAVTVLQEARRLHRGALVLGALGAALAHSGKKEAAAQILNEVQEQRREAERTRQFYVSPYHLAIISSALGEKNQALDWLKKGIEERTFWMMHLRNDPELDPLREEPRFKELLSKLNFPP